MYRGTKGTLFATSDGISFLGKNFFSNKSIHIRWDDIIEIVNNDKTIGSTPTISLLTNDEKTRHVFTKVEKHETALKALTSFHNDSLHDVSDTSTVSCSEVSLNSQVETEENDLELQAKWIELQNDDSYSKHAIQVREWYIIKVSHYIVCIL